MTRTVCGRCEMDECRCCRREATYLPAISERRERIATAVLAVFVGSPDVLGPKKDAAVAVAYADALIAALDKEPKP